MRRLKSFAMVLIFGLRGEASFAIASGFVQSEWTAPVSNVTMRVTCPSVIEASREGLDFFIKCEIKNVGREAIRAVQRGRIWVVDDNGQTNKCLRFMFTNGVPDSALLSTGESTTWWQHGKAPHEGAYKMSLRWDGDESLQSPALAVRISPNSLLEGDAKTEVTRCLQEHVWEFTPLTPNTGSKNVSYVEVPLTNNPVVVNGFLYSGFSFTMPQSGGELVWSFIGRDVAHNKGSFGIEPASGDMAALLEFTSEILVRDVPGIAHKGDAVIFQSIDRDSLKAGETYLFWFRCEHRDIPSICVSLNILHQNQVSLPDVFTAVYDNGL